MEYTKNRSYEEKKEWQPVVDEDMPFSNKEFEQYEDDYEEDYDYQYDDKGNIIGIVPRWVGEMPIGPPIIRNIKDGPLIVSFPVVLTPGER